MVKPKIETVDKLVDEAISHDNSQGSDGRNNSLVLTDEERIGASLLKIQTSKPFAASHEFEPEYHTSIQVHEVGTIDMPLKESQARQIIAKAHPPAPHDYGGDITTDASAGKIWELSPDEFTFGEDWPMLLNYVDHVANPWKHLWPLSNVSVEKMVIYEKGATYKAHIEYALHT